MNFRKIDLLSIAVLTMALSCTTASQAASLNGFDLDDGLVHARDIRRGGPPRDGIPALTSPRFVAAAAVNYLAPGDRVLGLNIGGEQRAYPIKIMNYHEIVNDQFGEQSVILTFCPLCGTGIAFNGTIAGERYAFGVSGLLYNSDVLMYDRRTESLWAQVAGQAVTGPMKGTELERLAMAHTTWQAWQAQYPETEVLSINTGYATDYYRDPYRGYASSSQVWFPVDNRDRRLDTKDLILGLELDGQFKAYSFDDLPAGVDRIADELAGRSIVVEYDLEHTSGKVLDDSGTEIPTFIAFWFAWAAFHPDTEVYEAATSR